MSGHARRLEAQLAGFVRAGTAVRSRALAAEARSKAAEVDRLAAENTRDYFALEVLDFFGGGGDRNAAPPSNLVADTTPPGPPPWLDTPEGGGTRPEEHALEESLLHARLGEKELAALLKQEGQAVAAGELVAVVDTVPLHLQLKEAEAGLKELAAALRAREHEIKAAQAELRGLDRDHARILPLVKEGALPPQQEEKLATGLEAAHQALGIFGLGGFAKDAAHEFVVPVASGIITDKMMETENK